MTHRLTALALASALSLAALPAHAQDESNEASSGAPQLSADMSFEEWDKLPQRVRYSPGGPIPPYYEHRLMIKKGMAITGGSILGGTYLASTMVGVWDQALYPLLIPVVGPWVTIATSAQEFDYAPPAVWFLTMDGLAQATGLVLFVWGLTDKQDFLVKKPYGFASLHVVPSVGPEYAGGVVFGTF